ncbi:GntR family transcriptional regulator [Clostridium sp. Ade.TY]|uniref:GntR family transcriptional regulator n=1 Tax=Clostridium sp. Ade.TY TaxID=1391647 RepID=UPI0003FB6BE0|nr:GntR family transcriptional regulator [Clostridium sp. Ade.TY]
MLKYEEIASYLKEEILNEKYKANEQLPFEKDICKKFNTSKMTVKKALDILVNEGLIVKRRGSGTFVKDISKKDILSLNEKRQLLGLTNNKTGHKITSELLEFKIINANKKIAYALKIDDEDFVCLIHRVRYIDNEAFSIEKTYMPISVVEGIKKSDALGSVYNFLENKLNFKIQSAHSTVRASKSEILDRKYLLLKEDEPVIEVERIGYLENGRVFEYSFSRHRYDKFEFKAVTVR